MVGFYALQLPSRETLALAILLLAFKKNQRLLLLFNFYAPQIIILETLPALHTLVSFSTF